MSKSEPRRTLRLTSEDDGVRITLLDQSLEQVGHDVQTLELKLPPGLYEARFEAGSSIRNRVISLGPGAGTKTVHQPKIPFASAAPLDETRDAVPTQSAAAERASLKVHKMLGRGSKLVLFFRDTDRRGRSNPARGVTLHSAEGERVGDIVLDGESRDGGDSPPWAACTYQLPRGSWRLRSRAPGAGMVEQSLITCGGWQTQVFVQRRGSSVGAGRYPDLADASVLMAKADGRFHPELAMLRAAEIARQGLRDHRTAVAAKDLSAMLFGKRKNPMLAIYGAHLLIHAQDADREFLAEVTSNLRELIGEHPDVLALDLWLDPDAEVGSFVEPPMLLSSWSIIVAATARRHELVPRGSLSAAIAERVLAGGPWLRWRAVRRRPAEAPASRAPRLPLGAAIARLGSSLPEPYASLYEELESSPTQSEVISFALRERERAEGASDAAILEQLRVPRVVAEDAIDAVLARLDA